MTTDKRNTHKEKAKENKRFPYRSLTNQQKYRIVDSKGKSYGEYREKCNAWKEIDRLSKQQFRDDLMLEHLE